MILATPSVDRNYIDNFSVKKFTEEYLVPKYFPDIDVSYRHVGMIGFTTEQVSNISEDLFNTATVLFRETFPNRSQIPESIYSHAAIFQLSDIFSSAASCNFLLVLEEKAILKNVFNDITSKDPETGIYRFVINKNTIINVEDIPFTLDYDIELRIARKLKKGLNNPADNEFDKYDYVYSASYIIPENFRNSMTNDNSNNDPYIKIRRSADRYIALEIRCHQCVRQVKYEDIITNSVVNYPVIDIPFDGNLAGFDIRYKLINETDDDYKQLKTLVIYSQPIDEPFCYYQLKDESTLRITFNSKDEYYMPEYGTTLEITLYVTMAGDGNFDVYTGNQISINNATDNPYVHITPYLASAKPLTASSGGRDKLTISELQSLAVMMYRTADALTTEHDLSEFFSNYPILYDNSEILFIKRRNDIYERVYGAFILMKKNDYIYHTNTVDIDMNLANMDNVEKNIFMIHPGTLFTDVDNITYKRTTVEDPAYLLVVNDNIPEYSYKASMMIKYSDIKPYIDDIQVNEYVVPVEDVSKRGFVEFFKDPDRKEEFDECEAEYNALVSSKDESIYYSKNDSSAYVNIDDIPIHYLEQRPIPYAQFANKVGVKLYSSVFDFDKPMRRLLLSNYDNLSTRFKRFLYVNPFLIKFKKNPNLISTYMTYVNESSVVDFTYKYDDSYVQFILYQLKVNRLFEKEKRFKFSVSLMPSIKVDDQYPLIDCKTEYSPDLDIAVREENDVYATDSVLSKFVTEDSVINTNTFNNDLRVFVVIFNGNVKVCYIELYPTEYSDVDDIYTFTSEVYTDDHISSDGRLRLVPGTIYKRYVYRLCLPNVYRSKLVVADSVPNSVDEIDEMELDPDDVIIFDPATMIRYSDIVKDLPPLPSGDTVLACDRKSQIEPCGRYVHVSLSDDYYKEDSLDWTKFYHYDANGNPIEDGSGVNKNEHSSYEMRIKLEKGEIREWSRVVNLLPTSSEILIPMEDVKCAVYTAYRRRYSEDTFRMELIDFETDDYYDYDKERDIRLKYVLYGDKESSHADDTLDDYFITNEYMTLMEPITFMRPLNNVRSTLLFKNYITMENGEYLNDVMDIRINKLPVIRWSEAIDEDLIEYFMNSFLKQYNNLLNIIDNKLRNETTVDIKFYNSYGRSSNFVIGENDRILHTINLEISFDIWYVPGTDLVTATPEVKNYIKTEIETMNKNKLNNLYISNLMRKIESNFAYVDHMKFNSINGQGSDYQAVKNRTVDIKSMTVEERRNYVPEFLVVNTSDIIINEFFAT
jgi:hypothetical protein